MPNLASSMLSLSLLTVACADSHGTGVVDAGRLFPQPGSWNVVATLEPTEGAFPDGAATLEHAFTMVVNGSPDSVRVVAGTFGDDTEFVMDVPDDHQLVTTETIEIAIANTLSCGGRGPVRYEGLSLRFDDLDGDDSDESMSGTARGSIRIVQGDVVDETPFTATFVGVRDTVGPAIEITGAHTDRNPVDGVFARIGEPVSVSTIVTLVDPEGTEVVLERPEGRESSFVTPPGTVLGFATTYDVQVRAFADLASNRGVGLPLSITTIADPGVQPEDGFEGGAHAATTGPVALVSSADGARVLSGASSLVFVPSAAPGAGGGRATLRLAVAPGDTTLHLRYALLASETDEGWLFADTRVLADGSTPVTVPLDTSTTDAWTDTAIPHAPRAGPTREVSVALPGTAVARGEVVLDVEVGATNCGGPLPMLLGLMLDDVAID